MDKTFNLVLSNLPEMSEKVILLTGATNGIGLAIAQELAATPAQLILHGRNPQKLGQVMAQLRRQHPRARLEAALADFADLDAVAIMAEDLKQRFPDLNVLINNAGMMGSGRPETEGHIPLAVRVNHLAPVLLSMALLPTLLNNKRSRIVTVSSLGHRYSRKDTQNLFGSNLTREMAIYCRSKLLLIAYFRHLGRQLAHTDLSVALIHPGIVLGTGVTKAGFFKKLFTTSEAAAKAVLNAALNQDLGDSHGAYFEGMHLRKPSAGARDLAYEKLVWERSLEALGYCTQLPGEKNPELWPFPARQPASIG